MHDQAERADAGEQHEARRQKAVAELVDDKEQELGERYKGHLATAGTAVAEGVRHFLDLDRARRGRQDVERIL